MCTCNDSCNRHLFSWTVPTLGCPYHSLCLTLINFILFTVMYVNIYALKLTDGYFFFHLQTICPIHFSCTTSLSLKLFTSAVGIVKDLYSACVIQWAWDNSSLKRAYEAHAEVTSIHPTTGRATNIFGYLTSRSAWLKTYQNLSKTFSFSACLRTSLSPGARLAPILFSYFDKVKIKTFTLLSISHSIAYYIYGLITSFIHT